MTGRPWTYEPCKTPATSSSPWCAAALELLRSWDPEGRSLGCFARRPIRGSTAGWSVHACGRAVDWRPSTREAGWRLWFRLIDAGAADLQLVLWDGFQWGGRVGPIVRRIVGADPHADHLHIESRNATPA